MAAGAGGGGAGKGSSIGGAGFRGKIIVQEFGVSSNLVIGVAPPPPSGNGLTVGTQFTSLSVSELGPVQAGKPFVATVLALRGQVPSGSTVTSADGVARASVMTRWEDGSASVIVFSGLTTGAAVIPVHVATGADSLALGAAAIAARVGSLSVNFGPHGAATANLAAPSTVWYSNSRMVHASYRVAAPGHASLEAVVYVTAWADRAFVEVVIENAKVDIVTGGVTPKPAAASYTAAVVTVNGVALPAINGNGGPEGAHSFTRAVYCSAWVGSNPQVVVNQVVADTQKHPLFPKIARPASAAFVATPADTYGPWQTGRQRGSDMGAGANHPSIGPLPQWDMQFLQSGDVNAAKAVEASTLAVLGYNINYRSAATGLVPTAAEIGSANMQNGSWPYQINATSATSVMLWELAHHPAAGLMAFVCRPSAVFIEIAQKVAVWNGCWSNGGVGGRLWNYSQPRGIGWGLRSLSHAKFITPDWHVWKDGAETWIATNVAYLKTTYQNNPAGKLNLTWTIEDQFAVDQAPNNPGFQMSPWMHQYLSVELGKLATANIVSPAVQADLSNFADWCLLQPVRWVNEQANGRWRAINYHLTAGSGGPQTSADAAINGLATYTAQVPLGYSDDISANPNTGFLTTGADATTSHAALQVDPACGPTYPSYWWAALVEAVNRNVPGALQAWATVQAGLPGLELWLNGAGTDPRYGVMPKVTPPPVGFAAGSDVGSISNDVWNPGRTAGVVNAVSWAITPLQRWFQVANTRMDSLAANVLAAIPGWVDRGSNGWGGVTDSYSGIVVDQEGGRIWSSGGGHFNSSNDGQYLFSLFKMMWSVEMLPTNSALWGNPYPDPAPGFGSLSSWPPNMAAYAAKLANGTAAVANDVFYDKGPEGKRTSVHTYSGRAFIPDQQKIVEILRQYWEYSLTSGTYVHNRQIEDTLQPADLTSPGFSYENVSVVYDTVTKELLAWSAGNSKYRSIKIHVPTRVWGIWAAPLILYSAAQCQIGRDLVVVTAPRSEDFPDGRWMRYSLDSRSTISTGVFQYGPNTSQFDFENYFPDYWDGAGVAPLGTTGKFWFVTKRPGLSPGLFEINSLTTPWTITKVVGQPGLMPTFGDFIENKMFYCTLLNAIVLLNSATENFSIYRLG